MFSFQGHQYIPHSSCCPILQDNTTLDKCRNNKVHQILYYMTYYTTSMVPTRGV